MSPTAGGVGACRTDHRSALSLLAILLVVTSVPAGAALAGPPAGTVSSRASLDDREKVAAVLADHAGERDARRLAGKLERAFREARTGRDEVLRAAIVGADGPRGRHRLIRGLSLPALRSLTDELSRWTSSPDAAARRLAALLDVRRDEARLLLDAFGPLPRSWHGTPPGEGPCAHPLETARHPDSPGMTGPVPIDERPPRLPPRARRQGLEGRAVFEVLVGCAGRVRDARLLESSGHETLDAAARESVVDRTFEPALEQGRPVPAKLVLAVEFARAD